ncbi:MAG TPA: hypothetical protein VMP67_07735 [Candidatus Limnocylindria bacterium]|nr:hypothetical protein [Candidatus Limnocylindria bacterium]
MAQKERITISAIVAIAVFSIIYAVAASLNVSAGTLGAGSSDVTSCDSDGVATTFATTFSSSLGGYKVTTVSVTGVDTPACDGRTLKVTLFDAADQALGEQTVTLGTPAADPTNLDFNSDDVLASDVHKVAVVISG